MISLFLKCLLGAAAVLVIALLSQSRMYFIAGMVPLFPTFALIAHYFVGSERGADALRTTALFGLWSLLPYTIYLISVVVLSGRLSVPATLIVATLAWTVGAMVLLLSWSRFHPAV